jgi:hypothetical protein
MKRKRCFTHREAFDAFLLACPRKLSVVGGLIRSNPTGLIQ